MKRILILIPMVTVLFAFTYVNSEGSDWVAPASAKKIENPVAVSKRSSSAKAGKKIFKTRCFVCHGDAGKGDGPAGKSLTPKPADLTSERVQKQTDGEIFWKISNGRGPMIKWEGILSEKERWDMVNYVRSIKAE
jgi:mono/diheme cytochrome c family protein